MESQYVNYQEPISKKFVILEEKVAQLLEQAPKKEDAAIDFTFTTNYCEEKLKNDKLLCPQCGGFPVQPMICKDCPRIYCKICAEKLTQ